MKMNDSDLFFTCSLLEEIGRETRQRRRDVVALLGRKVVAHIYENAGTLHCEPVPKTAEVFIRLAGIPQGKFDNVATCQYTVPDYWTIGKVYARLIEDVCDTNVIDTLLQVYESPVSDAISNYNSDFFYQPRGFLKEQFLQLPTPPHHPNAPTPKIRFQNFSEKWEKRKLGEYLETSLEKNSECTYTTDDVLSVSGDFGVVNQIEFQGRSFAGASVANYGILQLGDVVYTKSPLKACPYGIIKTNKFKTGIVSVLYGIYHTKENICADFVQTYFELNSRLNHYLRPLVNKGAKNTLQVSDDDALQGEVVFPPTKPEQEKIGVFFQKLDRLIALHREKEEKLRNLKKALLERMFPRQGRKVPGIRFAGFAEPWKERKLGECFNERNERSAEGELLSVTINSGIRKFDELGRNDNSSEDKSHYKRVLPGDIAYNSMRMWQGASGHSPYDGIVSPAYTVITPREGVSSIFFSYLFKRESMIQIFQNRSQGITSDTWNLKFPAFSEIDTALPTKPEQEKIGVFFQKLDRLIALHREKEEKLRNLKKALLERMFPRQGRKVPGIRFAGFAEPWKERKLGECFNERNERSAEGELLSVTINSGIRKFDELGRNDNSSEDKSHYKRVLPGDIAYNSMRMWQGASGHSPYDGIVSPAYTVITPREGVSSIFFSYLFKRESMIQIFQNRSQGITSDTWNLKFPAFSEIDTALPAKPEQEKLAVLFQKLDRLISLYQRRGEKLRCLKEGCLSGMFV